MNKLTIIYARQSVDKKDSISIESQIEQCRKKCSVDADDGSIRVITDKGYSGANTNRPGFKEMMELVRNNTVDTIAVYKIDRISRSLADFSAIYKVLNEHKVKFISAEESFDTSTPMGQAMLYIIMVFAQLERETIQERITTNYYARGRRGMYLGGPPPFGYDKVPEMLNGVRTSKLIPNQYAEIVRELFERYAYTEASLHELAKELVETGVPAPKEKGWASLAISRILHNPAYVCADVEIYSYYKSLGCTVENDISDFIGTNGCALYGKRDRSKNKYRSVNELTLAISLHEGIVDSAAFLACQRKLSTNKQIGNSNKGKFTWLTGIIHCAHCKYSIRFVKKKTSDDRYAACAGRTNSHICDGLGRTVLLSEIEPVVEKALISHMHSIKDVLLKSAERKKIDNSLCIELKKNEENQQAILEQMMSPNLSPTVREMLNRKMDELCEECQRIQEEIERSSEIIPGEKNQLYHIYDIIDNWDNLDLKEKRQISHYFISDVLVSGDSIEVIFKHNFRSGKK